MPRGQSDIPELRLEVLQKFVTKFTAPPQLMLSQGLFPTVPSPSSTIKWESQEGSRGMSQFKPPGAPTPQTEPLGVAQHSAEAAFWGEKMYFDEEFLNNLRAVGTESTYLPATARLAKEMGGLSNREARRREWMFSKMLFDGSFSYHQQGGVIASVNYSIPSSHVVTLGANVKWGTGVNKNILGDIMDGKKIVADDCGGIIDYAVMNSVVLRYIAFDTALQNLLSKSTFGQGDLFKGNKNNIVMVNPKVLGSLLDIQNLIVYDEKFEVRSYLTAVVTGGSTTTISVSEPADFEAGGILKFVNTSNGTFENETIASVDQEAGTVTVSTAPTASFRAARDYVSMVKGFISDDRFGMFASRVEGQPIAEYKEAPFGLKHTYGVKTDKKDVWDPEGIFIRIQNKGLPVLYQRDGIYTLDVE